MNEGRLPGGDAVSEEPVNLVPSACVSSESRDPSFFAMRRAGRSDSIVAHSFETARPESHPPRPMVHMFSVDALSAEPNVYMVDSPDLDLSRSETTWKFVFRKAWGDCPSGCLNRELLFFSVESGKVEKIDPARAMALPGFAEIAARRGWGWR